MNAEREKGMLFVILVLLTALLVSSPYISVALKRRKILRRLEAIAKRNGFRVRKLIRFPLIALNRGRGFEYLFESKTHAYAVKLWSAIKRDASLVIKADGRFFVTSTVASPMDTDASNERGARRMNSAIKSVPVTKNNYRIKKGKPVINVMLYYPRYADVILDIPSGRISASDGDRIFDKIFCSPAYFENMLSAARRENGEVEISNGLKVEK